MFAVGQRSEAIDTGFGQEDHAAAVAAVAAVGAAARNEFLAAKAEAAVASFAGRHLNFHSIDEHGGRRSRLALADDVYSPAVAIELDDAIYQREERVVFALADIPAWVKAVAHLADQDIAGDDALAAEPLNAPLLGLRIAAVAA